MKCQFCGRRDARVVRGAETTGLGATKRAMARQRFAYYHVECREDFAADEALRFAASMEQLRREFRDSKVPA